MRKRAIVLAVSIVFGFIVIGVRLADIMLLEHGKYFEKAMRQQLTKEDVQVKRGLVFDRKGREMAVNLDLESLYCDPLEISEPEDSARVLSEATGKPPKALLAKLSSDTRFIWLDRKLNAETVTKIKDAKLSGIGFRADSKRFYPKGALAAHILGFTNIDNKGIEGVELKYDSYLRGISGKVVRVRDASGRTLSEGVDMESRGSNMTLTIDEGLQYIVELELERALKQWNATAVSAIMMDPFTGDILALANKPSYNPNLTNGGYSSDRKNRSITDSYEPGSTFKIIIGAAALEEGAVKTGQKFDCSRGAIEVGGRLIHDAHRHGVLSFREVIQKSSNVGSVMIGMKLGKENVYKYAKSFGFGEKTGIDLPGEVAGRIRPPEKWSGMSIGSISIGQEVAVTPLQILRAYSAIGNGGFLVTPHVVSKITAPDGALVSSFKPEMKRIISQKTAETFKDILKTVTEQGGTATSAAVKGNQVAGKTGTAQVIDPRTKKYSKEKFIGSFVGFVPADNPKIAMIIVVYEPKGQNYGGIVAAPVFNKIAESALSYMNVPIEDKKDDLMLVVK